MTGQATYAEMLAGLAASGYGFEIFRHAGGPLRGRFVIIDNRLATLEPCGHSLPSPPPHPRIGEYTYCFYCCSGLRRVGAKR